VSVEVGARGALELGWQVAERMLVHKSYHVEFEG